MKLNYIFFVTSMAVMIPGVAFGQISQIIIPDPDLPLPPIPHPFDNYVHVLTSVLNPNREHADEPPLVKFGDLANKFSTSYSFDGSFAKATAAIRQDKRLELGVHAESASLGYQLSSKAQATVTVSDMIDVRFGQYDTIGSFNIQSYLHGDVSGVPYEFIGQDVKLRSYYGIGSLTWTFSIVNANDSTDYAYEVIESIGDPAQLDWLNSGKETKFPVHQTTILHDKKDLTPGIWIVTGKLDAFSTNGGKIDASQTASFSIIPDDPNVQIISASGADYTVPQPNLSPSNPPGNSVPEPGSFLLLGLGLPLMKRIKRR